MASGVKVQGSQARNGTNGIWMVVFACTVALRGEIGAHDEGKAGKIPEEENGLLYSGLSQLETPWFMLASHLTSSSSTFRRWRASTGPANAGRLANR